MEKFSNSSLSSVSNTLDISKPGTRLSEENENLIRKLESSYQVSNKQESDTSATRFYALALDNLKLLIDVQTSCELLDDNVIYTIPQVSEWLRGVVNVRGNVVPIIDLENIVTGKKQTPNKKSKIIIINLENAPFGVFLTQLPKIITFDSNSELSDFSKLPLPIQPFVRFAYLHDKEIWAAIDFQKFIQSKTS